MIDVFTALTLLTIVGVIYIYAIESKKQKTAHEHYLEFKAVAERHNRLREVKRKGTESFKFMDNLIRQEMARSINRAIPERRK